VPDTEGFIPGRRYPMTPWSIWGRLQRGRMVEDTTHHNLSYDRARLAQRGRPRKMAFGGRCTGAVTRVVRFLP